MPRRARLTPRARVEAREAIRWIAADSPAAARALRAAIDALLLLIGEHPRIGVSRPELASEPYRIAVIRGFPYLAIYNADTRPPSIVRLVHGARDLPQVLTDLRGFDPPDDDPAN